jgi:CDP-diglyceride synthetase
MKDLAQRAASSLVGALIVLAWLFLAQRFEQRWAIALLLVIVTLWTGLEYLELLRKSGDRIPPYSFLTLALLIVLVYGFAD